MNDLKRQGQHYFDDRSATYDQDEVHPQVARALVAGADLRPGLRVLDLATGTGLLAFEALERVGPSGEVVGIDLSPGMLAQATRKAERRSAEQGRALDLTFVQGDAEHLELADASFDRVLCASGLVMMNDVPAALRGWARVLRPGGLLAFDVPDARAFGPRGIIAEVSAQAGVPLAYAEIGGTRERCRQLLWDAGLEVLAVRTQTVQDGPVPLADALAVWDRALPHPSWHGLRELPEGRREQIHAAFVARLEALSVDGLVPSRVRLHLAFGRKPSGQP